MYVSTTSFNIMLIKHINFFACVLSMSIIILESGINYIIIIFVHVVDDTDDNAGYLNPDAGSISESSSDIIELNEAELTKKLGNANPSKPRNSCTPRIETDV